MVGQYQVNTQKEPSSVVVIDDYYSRKFAGPSDSCVVDNGNGGFRWVGLWNDTVKDSCSYVHRDSSPREHVGYFSKGLKEGFTST